LLSLESCSTAASLAVRAALRGKVDQIHMTYVYFEERRMAKRGDSAVLRLVVIFLRSCAHMTQARFGKESRVDQAQVSHFEIGDAAPSEDVLRRMAKAARLDWLQVVHLRQFYTSLLTWSARTGKPLDIGLPEPALLAVAPYWIELHAEVPDLPSPDQEREVAAKIWEALERHPVPLISRLVKLSPRAGDWALAEQACAASVRRAAHSAEEAMELAGLAFSIAERVPGEERWRWRLLGYCWAHTANARRVANDLAGADEAFVRAWDLWRTGADTTSVQLAEWKLFSLEASLRRDQLRFSTALERLDQARATSRNDQVATARILLQKGNILEQMGDSERALTALKEAAPFVEASGDARLILCHRFDTANNLALLSRYEEAAELLPQVREWTLQQANDLDLIRLVWLESRVTAGVGRAEEAASGLEKVRDYFTDHGLAYDAALSSLDLAVLRLSAGRTAEVKELAIAMGWIFEAQGIDREALAALKLFCDAACQESATVELARRVVVEIEKARRSAPAG
jgi:tetratricopeptide (TPR) repeat protein